MWGTEAVADSHADDALRSCVRGRLAGAKVLMKGSCRERLLCCLGVSRRTTFARARTFGRWSPSRGRPRAVKRVLGGAEACGCEGWRRLSRNDKARNHSS